MTKKFFMPVAMLAMSLAGFAQTDTDPNRLLVAGQGGGVTSYMIDRVDELRFATVEGRVAADVQIVSHTLNEVVLNVERTDECQGFMINVLPGVMARQLEGNPAGAESYLNYMKSPTYYEDFEEGTLSGIELNSATEYAVVTLGYDIFATACDLSVAYFTTSSEPLVGDPKVVTTVTDKTLTTISFKFDANKDVKQFSFVIGEKGTLAQQFEQFAGMFGFTNIGQMVQMWGVSVDGNQEYTYTYENLNPNTEYELYVQAWDVNDTFAPLDIVECETDRMGGSGEASVNIQLKEYKLAEWDGEMKPSQYISFTPNNQSWCYRIGVYLEEQYDENREAIIADLCSDPPMPAAYWFFYEPLTTDYQINPDTKAVAVAAAKNGDGVWGPVNEVRFTTPSQAASMPELAPSVRINERKHEVKKSSTGRVPAISGGVRLLKK